MASLLIGAGVLAYDKVQSSRQKKKEAKMAHNQNRFEELERENRERVGRLNGGHGGTAQQQQQSFYAAPAEPRLMRRESRTSTHSLASAAADAAVAEEAPPPAYEDVVQGAGQSHSRRLGGNSTEAVRAPEIGGGGGAAGVDRWAKRGKSFFGRRRRGTGTEGDGVVR